MLRWLLLIPFGLLLAMGAGFFGLLLAGAISPELGLLIGSGFERLVAAIFDALEDGFDPAPTAELAFSLIGRLGFAVLVAPVLVVAIVSEVFRLRGGLVQSGLTGTLAALLPLGMLGLARVPTMSETRVISALFLVGAVTGFVYWLIAGRTAGGEREGSVASR
jgi:hypothetical protein